MAARNAKRRAKFRVPEPAAVPDAVLIDWWVPDDGRQCEACGQSPCVSGMTDGVVVYEGALCGVCTWCEPRCADPANW
jgi:hypothetical protein